MTFKQATEFKQMDWEQPEHTEKRNKWDGDVRKVPPKEQRQLNTVKDDWDDGIEDVNAVGIFVNQYHSKIDSEEKKDSLLHKNYEKFFKKTKIDSGD